MSKNINDMIDKTFVFHMLADHYVGENSGNNQLQALSSFSGTTSNIQEIKVREFIRYSFGLSEKICDTEKEYEKILYKFKESHKYEYGHKWKDENDKIIVMDALRLNETSMEGLYNDFNVLMRMSELLFDDIIQKNPSTLLVSGYQCNRWAFYSIIFKTGSI